MEIMKMTANDAGRLEPTLHCPNCNYEIKLTESLAAPLLAESRRRFQEQLAQNDAEVAGKLAALRQEHQELAVARTQTEEQVQQRLAAERVQLMTIEATKAKEAAAAELEARAAEATELRRSLEANNAKLAE